MVVRFLQALNFELKKDLYVGIARWQVASQIFHAKKENAVSIAPHVVGQTAIAIANANWLIYSRSSFAQELSIK